MAIAEQFAGLQMDKLIGAPLTAAADASVQLANSTADFINRVGFDSDGSLRTVAFAYQRRSVNEDGTSNLDEMKVDVPMLAIVPIPNLQVDEVNVLFDMEVKQSEKQESSLDIGANINATVNLGIVKVSVTGNVSAHQSNTRSSDNSAKYHVDVRATNHGIPEGLARVLDMMAANVAPSLVGSTLKDGNGQDLSESARVRAQRLKGLRQEISQIENRLKAAQDGLDSNIQRLKKIAQTQQNVYHSRLSELTGQLKGKDATPEDDKKFEELTRIHGEVSGTWNNLQNQAADLVKMIADADSGDGQSLAELSPVFTLKKLVIDKGEKTASESDYDKDETYYNTLRDIQNNAIKAQKAVDGIEKELLDKRVAYDNAMSGTASTPAIGAATGSTT